MQVAQDAHSDAGSTDVPSPHSLKVVISCQGSADATMSRMFCPQRAASRPSRARRLVGLPEAGADRVRVAGDVLRRGAGAYWCQLAGWLEQLSQPGKTLSTT